MPQVSPRSSNLNNAVITMIELPWWQVLIDGPLIHYWLTGTLPPALTGILPAGRDRATQSSRNLTAEVSRKHRHAREQQSAQNRHSYRCTRARDTHANASWRSDRGERVQTCTGASAGVHIVRLRKSLTATHSRPRTHTHILHTHSISLNDMRLTHIDYLIFARVVWKHRPRSHSRTHTHTSPYSSVSSGHHISESDLPKSCLHVFWISPQHANWTSHSLFCTS